MSGMKDHPRAYGEHRSMSDEWVSDTGSPRARVSCLSGFGSRAGFLHPDATDECVYIGVPVLTAPLLLAPRLGC